jgi:hypothetical protein
MGRSDQRTKKWLILFTLLTGIPAILGLVGYFGRKDATTGWFKVVAGIVGIEKWLLVGLLLFIVLLAAGSGSKRRR